MTTGARKAGEFCWINMLTPQPAEARTFFSKLLGWTYVEMPGIGHAVQVGGRDIGGLFDLAGPNTPRGTPPLIGDMVKVENADAICARVAALGGKAMPAFDIMDQGRMAVCFDPKGAEFDVWQPRKGLGTDVDSNLRGAPSWFETMTTDVDRAAHFYSRLFGWTPEAMPMPGAVHDPQARYPVHRGHAADHAADGDATAALGNVLHREGRRRNRTQSGRTPRQALRAGAGRLTHRPILRHHVTAGRRVLRHQVRALRLRLVGPIQRDPERRGRCIWHQPLTTRFVELGTPEPEMPTAAAPN